MPSIPYNMPMGEPRPYYEEAVTRIVGAASTYNIVGGASTPQHPAIQNVEKVSKPAIECKNSTCGHQFHEEVIEERRPIYSLGSFCRFVKIRKACGCGIVLFGARLYLGDIYITGDWPEDVA